MLQLQTLGCLRVRQTDGALGSAAVRPRPLALLAVVASARGLGVSRDKLLAMFWPESDTEHARNCLKQTLFALRKDLHDDLFITRTGSLRLNPAVIIADTLQLEAARARGAHATAVGLYAGPFLDGFHLPGLPEFERWMEGERLRLARAHQTSLESLAMAAYEAGDWHAAADWWRQLATLDPLNSRFALRLMRALAATGARTEALQFGRVYCDQVRAEIAVAPDVAVTSYIDWLSRHPEARLRRWPHTPAPPRAQPPTGWTKPFPHPPARGRRVSGGHPEGA